MGNQPAKAGGEEAVDIEAAGGMEMELQSKFMRLPDEVVLRIMSFLAVEEIGYAGATCTRLRKLAWEDDLWRKKHREVCMSPDGLYHALSTRGSHPESEGENMVPIRRMCMAKLHEDDSVRFKRALYLEKAQQLSDLVPSHRDPFAWDRLDSARRLLQDINATAEMAPIVVRLAEVARFSKPARLRSAAQLYCEAAQMAVDLGDKDLHVNCLENAASLFFKIANTEFPTPNGFFVSADIVAENEQARIAGFVLAGQSYALAGQSAAAYGFDYRAMKCYAKGAGVYGLLLDQAGNNQAGPDYAVNVRDCLKNAAVNGIHADCLVPDAIKSLEELAKHKGKLDQSTAQALLLAGLCRLCHTPSIVQGVNDMSVVFERYVTEFQYDFHANEWQRLLLVDVLAACRDGDVDKFDLAVRTHLLTIAASGDSTLLALLLDRLREKLAGPTPNGGAQSISAAFPNPPAPVSVQAQVGAVAKYEREQRAKSRSKSVSAESSSAEEI